MIQEDAKNLTCYDPINTRKESEIKHDRKIKETNLKNWRHADSINVYTWTSHPSMSIFLSHFVIYCEGAATLQPRTNSVWVLFRSTCLVRGCTCRQMLCYNVLWEAVPVGKCYVTINVTYTLNNNHTNCVGPSFVWLLLSVYVTLIVT